MNVRAETPKAKATVVRGIADAHAVACALTILSPDICYSVSAARSGSIGWLLIRVQCGSHRDLRSAVTTD